MSEENSGAVQGALLPREGISPRSVAERPAVRLTQVGGGQYVLSSPAHGLPALAQISNSSMSPSSTSASQSGVARIINFSPARVHSTSVRPSVANQNIVNALTKPRSVNNVRNHLMPNTEVGFVQTSSTRSPMKRSLSPTQREKEIYGAKLQRVLNHRSVRSQILREKYNENLMERYFLETSDSILELPQFAKRQKTQHYLAYLNDNVIDSKYTADEDTTQVIEPKVEVPVTTSSSPTNQNLTESSINTTTIASSTPITTVPEFISTKSITSNTIVKTRLSSNFSSPSNQEQIVEKAKQEAYVVQRISDLQKEGLWSEKRLPKVQEMSRIKAHWDFLLEEMIWLAADFAQERKWKKAAAKKCARMVQKHFQDKALAAQKAEKAHEQHLRRVASFCAREIKSFWANVEKLVEYKQHTRLEEKRKQALDQQLSFIVDQTEKYSQLLAKGMNKSAITNSSILSDAPTPPSTRAPSRLNSDDEFKPDGESTDDEETIAQEEEAGTDQHHEEIAALQRESEMDLETFLSELPKDYLQNRDKIKLSDSEKEIEEGADSVSHNTTSRTDDEDFIASSDSEDDEDTIQEQEKVEGTGNHKEEIEDLKAENEMSVDELKKKYSNLPPLSSIEKSSDTSSGSDSSDKNDEDPESEEDALSNSDVDVDISEDETQTDDIGLKSLLEDSASSSQNEGEIKTDNQDLIDDAAAIAESIQPKGNTLSSTSVVTPIPFLLKYTLREYQHIGLDWLVTMFERKLNGILADEMGLGKTIQTIALMAHLASEKENWGPHLIIVPTSVMLNWEMECKKWCPAFKILTYYGTQKERKQKRTGWTKPNAFHICITSYKLVIQDHQSFRRKKWKYLILDEAQNIKNFKSQRWQLLLNFSTQQRLLLTGTPLQNNLMELWSLMHFLMPHVFQSHREFKEWFSNPVTGMIEGNSEYNESIIKRLHKVLRPFLLRRLKSEVEKQMPKKYEHVVMCRLSKRQRFLYDDYMSRAKTKETLATGNLLSVINVLMQLRKVCNHPNLFEVRPTISPFQCDGIRWHAPSIVYGILNYDVWRHIEMQSFNMNLVLMELSLSAYQCYRMRQYQTPCSTIEEIDSLPGIPPYCPPAKLTMRVQKSPVNNTRTMEVPKGVMEIKPGQTIPPNLKYKLASPGVFQLVQQPLKVENCGQNKIMFQSVAGQMFHTSTGKQIILAPSTPMSISSAIAIPGSTVVTTGGQRLTLFPKQSVSGGQIVTNLSKGLPKIQLMSVASQINTSTLAVQHVNEVKADDDRDTGRKTVGSKFIDKLYSSQSNNLDVRWKKQPSLHKQPVDAHLDDGEIVIKDHFKNKLELIARINERRCSGIPLYGKDFQDSIKIYKAAETPVWGGGRIHCLNALYNMNTNTSTDCLMDMLYTPEQRIEQFKDLFDRFIVYVPAVQAPQPELQVWHPEPSAYWGEKRNVDVLTKYFSKPATCLHSIASAMVTQFPDPRLLQYDCGKLQTMDRLLRKLKVDGHRVLIFTQMTKMLDVLEAFLNFHGHIYLRLDGSTKVDQRQVLMERFNGDSRIFVFILSTRSGGIGVNLTGADTVIFYDSDWNPTMDAQAQDRCHRIGQTRDVHIYRLVSERTIEENILKKANQKRLLGDLAIEGGNFTTAFFKTSTIHDLFDVETREEHAVTRLSAVVQASRDSEPQHDIEQPIPTNYTEEKSAVGILENALAACEDDQDVIAARTATAEAVADLAEFDENIPLDDQEKEKEPEVSKAEQELENLIKQLTPVERYAMNFIEATEAAWSAEQLAAAEREIDQQKLEWEQNRLAALHEEEEERRAHDLEDDLDILTYSREDATNQMWCPPTPPQQDTDVYMDHTLSFLYNPKVMTESQLPPIFIKREAKRLRHDAGLIESRRPAKILRKEDSSVYAPRSLFERPSPALVKMRRDIKLQKYRGVVKPSALGIPGVKTTCSKAPEAPIWHNWTIHEDMALLRVIQTFQGLPLNLMVISPGHIPNWEFVADYVNTVSIAHRTSKQCRHRYDTVILPREEGKLMFDSSARKKKNKAGLYKFSSITKSHRPLRTSQLFSQDNNGKFTQMMIQHHEALKGVSTKQTPPAKSLLNNSSLKIPKHTAVLSECGIDLDRPVLPVEVAARRAERFAREKKSLTPEKLAVAQRLQLMKATQMAGGQSSPILQSSVAQLVATTTTALPITTSPISQPHVINQTNPVVTPMTTGTIVTSTTCIPNQLRTQRIIATPIQTPTTVVSVSGLNPTLQHGTQRLIVSGTAAQAKAVLGNATTVTGKPISPAQLQMIRQATLKQQQLRLQSGGLTTQGVKTTVTVAGQTAIQVQFTQSQPRTQFIKQGTVTVSNKQGITRTVTESEMAQLLKRQQQLQHQKALAAAAGVSNIGASQSGIQSLSPQVFAQALQAGSPGPVATLVKAVSGSGVTQTVSIPVTAVTIGGSTVKAAIASGIKPNTAQHLRQLQLQQQLLAQKKLVNQKIAGLAQVGKSGVATQLIVGSKPLPTAMTMQQFQQVIRSPITVQQGPVVLTKGTQRVIPVNTSQGKQTIQVVASQGLSTAIRPQASSTLAGALAGIKVQGATTSQAQQALLSQVSAALQSQTVGLRQSSPVRIQTANGNPIVAVSVQSGSNMQQGTLSSSNAERLEQMARFLKK